MRRLRLTPAGVGSGARVLGKPDSGLEAELRGAGTGSLQTPEILLWKERCCQEESGREESGEVIHTPLPPSGLARAQSSLNPRDPARAGGRGVAFFPSHILPLPRLTLFFFHL